MMTEDTESTTNKRVAELLAIEEARQAELNQRVARQIHQERILAAIVFGSVTLFLLAIVTLAVLGAI